MNPGQTLRTDSQRIGYNDVKLISDTDGIWAHYWGGHLYPIPYFFIFPKNQPLLRLWLRWHLPDITHKVCPYRFLKGYNVGHLPRGFRRLYKMMLVMEVTIMKI